MGQIPRGYPAWSSWGGTLPGQDGGYPAGPPGRVPPAGYPRATTRGYPVRGVPRYGTPQQGTPRARMGGTLPRGTQVGWTPGRVPPGQVRMGATKLGQQKEYSLHGGQYASCVHAGGLSCFECFRAEISKTNTYIGL